MVIEGSNQTNYEEEKEIVIPEFAQRYRVNFEHLSFMFTVFSAITVLWAFWNFENRLWNRVPFKIGLKDFNTLWYQDTTKYPFNEFMHTMLTNIGVMLLLTIVYGVAASILIILLYKKGTTTQRSYVLLTGVSLLVFLVAWWAEQSFWVHPNNWFRSSLDAVKPEYWKIGVISLPGTHREKTLFVIFRLTEFFALIPVVVDFVVDFFAFKRAYTEKKQREIKKEKKPMSLDRIVKWVLFYGIMIGFLIYTLFPVIYTLLVSLSSQEDLRAQTLATDPVHNFILNYSAVIFTRSVGKASFQTAFVNSVMLGVGTAIGGLSISLPAAYVIARYRFRGKSPIEFLILATQMFPGIILLIPQFLIWKELGLLATPQRKLFGTLLAYFAGSVAYTVWMMKGYFETIPRDLEEAAYIDGSSDIMTFLRISIPLAAPGMVAVGIFTFLGAWNEFALAQIFIGEKNPSSTLPLLFYDYQDTSAPDQKPYFQLLAAYSVLVALPIIIIFLSLQKLLARGVTAGGVK